MNEIYANIVRKQRGNKRNVRNGTENKFEKRGKQEKNVQGNPQLKILAKKVKKRKIQYRKRNTKLNQKERETKET